MQTLATELAVMSIGLLLPLFAIIRLIRLIV